MTNASSQSRPGAKKGVGCRCESERAHSVQWVGVGTAPKRTIRVNTSLWVLLHSRVESRRLRDSPHRVKAGLLLRTEQAVQTQRYLLQQILNGNAHMYEYILHLRDK